MVGHHYNLGQPSMNMRHFSSASSFMGTYFCSVSVQNLIPANTRFQLSGQQTGAVLLKKQKSHAILTGAKQVTLLMSHVETPCLTSLTMACFDSWNAFLRVWIQLNLELFLSRPRKSSTLGLNEYAQASWVTRPNCISDVFGNREI